MNHTLDAEIEASAREATSLSESVFKLGITQRILSTMSYKLR